MTGGRRSTTLAVCRRSVTWGLTKHYGSVSALKPLDLEVAEGEVLGYLGPNGAGKTTTIRLPARAGPGRAPGGPRSSASTRRRSRPRRTGGSPTCPGEANLWPGLTGAETLHLLGRVQGRVDAALPGRADRAVQARPVEAGPRLLEGQPAEGAADRGPELAGRPADPRRADDRARPADGADLPRVRPGGARRGQAVFLSSHILSEVEALSDRVAILRAGELVEVGTLARDAPPVGAVGRRHVRLRRRRTSRRIPGRHRGRGRRQPRPLPGASAPSSRCSACSPPRACTSCSAASRRWRSCSWPTTAASRPPTADRAGAR